MVGGGGFARWEWKGRDGLGCKGIGGWGNGRGTGTGMRRRAGCRGWRGWRLGGLGFIGFWWIWKGLRRNRLKGLLRLKCNGTECSKRNYTMKNTCLQ